MNLFQFEYRKFESKRLIFLLILLPILVIASLFIYSNANQPDIKRQETELAHRLLSDLNWQLPHYRDTLQAIPPEEAERNPEYQKLSTLFQHLDQAERERFDYSVASFYEDWQTVNQQKQAIWQHLLEASQAGLTLKSLDQKFLSRDKLQIDWLVNHRIDYLDADESSESGFVLSRSLPILLSLPAVIILIIFFGLGIFKDLYRPQNKFMLALNQKVSTLLRHKLGLFILFLGIYVLGMVVVSLGLGLVNDKIPMSIQWQYPLYYANNTEAVFNLGQVITYRIVLFICQSILLLLLILILNRIFNNGVFNAILVLTVLLFGMQVTYFWAAIQVDWNPFLWFMPEVWFEQTSHYAVFVVILALLGMGLLLLAFLSVNYHSVRRRKSRVSRSLPVGQPRFLLSFEFLKHRRDSLFVYSGVLILLITVFIGISGFQRHQDNVNQWLVDLQEQIQRLDENRALIEIKSQNQGFIDGEDHEQMLMAEEQIGALEAMMEDFAQGDFQGNLALEQEYLNQDYQFLTNQAGEPGTDIPVRDSIFMANAAINYQMSEWKKGYDIPYVLPGGPYYTEFLPKFEESPQSGEAEPPLSIDFNVFQSYLDRRSEDHWSLGAINGLWDFISHYFYFIILGLALLHFSTSYVREWDQPSTIRFMLAQPIKLTRIVKDKMLSANLSSLLILLMACVVIYFTMFALGGAGSFNFPVVEYLAESIGEASQSQDILKVPSMSIYYQIRPMYQVLLIAFSLLVLAIIFINQLSIFVSTWVKNRWLALSVVIMTLIVGMGLAAQEFDWLTVYSPFTYLNIPEIVTGRLANRMNQSHLNYITGLLSMGSTALLLTFLALFISRKEYTHDIR